MGLFHKEAPLPITDLHCHILPGIDDGAKDAEMSKHLLSEQSQQGVTQIMFTPHFYPNRMELEDFIRRRSASALQVIDLCNQFNLAGALGAEVHMAPQLAEMNLRKLALADTSYILLEWPFVGFPLWGDSVIDSALHQGLTPIFAHIERYDYLFYDTDLLDRYAEQGVLFQMNADTILSGEDKKQALHLIKNGYVHVLASDAHNMDARPPHLEAAFSVIEKKLNRKIANRLKENSDAIFKGMGIE